MQNSLKDRVLQAVDIVTVVGERVSLTRRGKEFVGLCPFHDDHKPSLNVSPVKQIFKCWSCGVGGDVIRFVQLSERIDFKDALARLAKRAGIEYRRQRVESADHGQRDELRDVLTWARDHFVRNLTADPGGGGALQYARARGLRAETIEQFQLGFAADAWDDLVRAAARVRIAPERLEAAGLAAKAESGKVYDRFRNRLIFPIVDPQGRTIAFGGRTLTDDPAKYLNSPETSLFSKSLVLYGLHHAAEEIRRARGAIVVEGYMDAVSLWQVGVRNVVATLGTALTDAHVRLLSRFADTVYLCFDPDEAGLRAADRAAETVLRGRLAARIVTLPDGEDPSDFAIARGADAFYEKLQSSRDALEFKWSLLMQRMGTVNPVARRTATQVLLEFVARVTLEGGMDPLDQGILVGRLSELLGAPSASVHEMLAAARSAAKRTATSVTPDTSDQSAYVESLGELSSGSVAAVETLFGIVLSDSSIFDRVRSCLASASEWCPTWQRLFAQCDRLFEDRGYFTRDDALAFADDPALCELVSRAVASSADASAEAADTLSAWLKSEADRLRMQQVRAQLGNGSDAGERDEAFATLLQLARLQRGPLASTTRAALPLGELPQG